MTFRVPPRVGYVVHEPSPGDPTAKVYLMHLPDGQPVVLAGSAALIWVVAAQGEQDVPATVAELLDEPLASVEETTRRYLVTLVAQGLLVEALESGDLPGVPTQP